jgi:hypothetical protein
MTKPEERGSRDTGSDLPSGGPADRPSGAYKGDESVPQHGEAEKPDFETGFTTEPPRDVKPEVPPYEGRQTTAKQDSGQGDDGGARTGGAVKPTSEAGSKDSSPSGGTTSPAQEQPASQAPETGRSDDGVDAPAHTPGTGRAENKR